MFFI
ncbi:hypothetical protein D046_7771A, partial [Vibrio parahaemolyticus V-223/04]|jgi:hypothetical protein